MAPAIDVRGLRKSYGDLEAVKGIDLSVPEGAVFALLGPNGAGKTTTVEILEGYRSRDAGEVSVLGFDPARGGARFRSQIGIVLQSTGVDVYLTVAETIDLFRQGYPSPRPRDEVIELVGLTPKRNTRVSKLSGGQQRRLDVAVALAGRDTAATTVRFRLPEEIHPLPDAIRSVATVADGVVQLRTQDPTRTLYELTGWAVERGIRLEGLDVTRPSLEDVYLEITGRAERGAASGE